MKIKYCEQSKPQKIWHRKPGDVVRLYYNDGTPQSDDYVLVLQQDNAGTHIFNLSSNQKRLISCSIRCTFYPNAELNPGKKKC